LLSATIAVFAVHQSSDVRMFPIDTPLHVCDFIGRIHICGRKDRI